MTTAPEGGRTEPGGYGTAPVSIAVRQDVEPDCWTVVVAGEVDVATSSELRDTIEDVIDRARRLSIDLTDTTFIDSSGLGVLVGARKRALDRGSTELRLVGLQDPVRRVLEITGLTELFELER